MEEWRHIQGLLDKIRSTGMGGISADDPEAVPKLKRETGRAGTLPTDYVKEVNVYYRKHGTLDGCAPSLPDQIEKLKADMARCSWLRKPFDLTNTSAEIRRIKERIEDLSKRAETEFSAGSLRAAMWR